MMTKSTHMFLQNHNARVKYWDTGNMVSKQSCQNTLISGWWNILRWDVLYKDNKHMAAINSIKECLESTWNCTSILNYYTQPLLRNAQRAWCSLQHRFQQNIWFSVFSTALFFIPDINWIYLFFFLTPAEKWPGNHFLLQTTRQRELVTSHGLVTVSLSWRTTGRYCLTEAERLQIEKKWMKCSAAIYHVPWTSNYKQLLVQSVASISYYIPKNAIHYVCVASWFLSVSKVDTVRASHWTVWTTTKVLVTKVWLRASAYYSFQYINKK